jgi:hypothetical protein
MFLRSLKVVSSASSGKDVVWQAPIIIIITGKQYFGKSIIFPPNKLN